MTEAVHYDLQTSLKHHRMPVESLLSKLKKREIRILLLIQDYTVLIQTFTSDLFKTLALSLRVIS